jgi:hypothetical protein
VAAGAEIADLPRPAAPTRRRVGALRVRRPHWSAPAWASIAVVVGFVVSSCWWLSRDDGIPVFDAGIHLGFAIDAYEALAGGHLLRAFSDGAPYPPLTHLVGALGIAIGGIDVAPPIIASNLLFVPLLALGCYQVARLAFTPLAGLLAVIFALGTPLIIEEFHEFMLDAPEAAMVAISLWAILATQHYTRTRASLLAGVAVGLGMLSKETFVFFIIGPALVTMIRRGRPAWRGIALFALATLIIAAPWYLHELTTIHSLEGEALGSSSLFAHQPPGIAPPRLSAMNLEWYFWSFLNWQLLLPLFVFAAVGLVWALAGFARRRPVSPYAAELLAGALVSWALLTETYVHDPRYSIPITPYLAILAAGWIPRLPLPARAAAATLLTATALANTLGVGYGIGPAEASAPTNTTYEQQPGRLTLYANDGLWVGSPTRDGDLLGLLRALRRAGVRELSPSSELEDELEFSFPGIMVLARIAGLKAPSTPGDPLTAGRHYAFLMHGAPEPGLPPPCIVLADGAGVWVRLGGSDGPRAWSYCP